MKWSMTAAELSDAIRQSDAPSREIDDRIWRWVNDQKLNPHAPGWQYDLHTAPTFTESLDAARWLLPIVDTADGPQSMDFVLEHSNGGLTIAARVGTNDPDAIEFGCNDASALSRAALVAHLRMEADGVKSKPLTGMRFTD